MQVYQSNAPFEGHAEDDINNFSDIDKSYEIYNCDSSYYVPLYTIDLLKVYKSRISSIHFGSDMKLRRLMEETRHNPYEKGNKDNQYVSSENGVLKVMRFTLFRNERYVYRVLDMLGSGSYAQVYYCHCLNDNVFYAIKVQNYIRSLGNLGEKELCVLNWIKQHNICNDYHLEEIHDYLRVEKHVCLVLPLYGKSLYDLFCIKGRKIMPLPKVRQVAINLLDALLFLHSHNIIHTDVKPENICVANRDANLLNSVVLLDYGSCINWIPLSNHTVQSMLYRAPEVILGCSYGAAIDVWSLGCVLYELATGEALFPGKSEIKQLYNIEGRLGPIPQKMIMSGKKPSYYEMRGNRFVLKSIPAPKKPNEGYSEVSKDDWVKRIRSIPYVGQTSEKREMEGQRREWFIQFLQMMLCIDPCERATINQLKQSSFITGNEVQVIITNPPCIDMHDTPNLQVFNISTIPLTQRRVIIDNISYYSNVKDKATNSLDLPTSRSCVDMAYSYRSPSSSSSTDYNHRSSRSTRTTYSEASSAAYRNGQYRNRDMHNLSFVAQFSSRKNTHH